ncbi:hypothetical protein P9239_04555 [Caballeronia sp. LZ062]|uniref:hypothetical protein n=1 Tax=unclassified Caballeronia TaxID=2646786 RepID=UPI00285C0A35|nr:MULTISPECIES: hypothetical protein [unclassified Caballeronia]MDR5856975.1 hypothetical protein [Caballeronia sp. LZ050]MDR5869628.1 hypothetical protein [Caballeronia sp. LZ062]
MTRDQRQFRRKDGTSDENAAFRVYSLVMAKNSQFSTDCIGRGIDARASRLAIVTRIDGTAIIGAIGTSKTRITKLSIKAITIR